MITSEMPGIESVQAVLPSSIKVRWKDGGENRIELAGWIAAGGGPIDDLSNPLFFATARVTEHGSAVAWGYGDDQAGVRMDSRHLRLLAEEQLPFTGRDLANWQRAQGLSNQEAADLLGVSLSGYNAYKTPEGKVPPPIAMLCRAMTRDEIVKQAHLRPRVPGRPPQELFLMFARKDDPRRLLILYMGAPNPTQVDHDKWTLLGPSDRLPASLARDIKRNGRGEVITRVAPGKDLELAEESE